MMCRIPKGANIRFIDSLQFLNCSLDKAVKQLDPTCFIQTGRLGLNYTSKPIFPYSFVTGFEILEAPNTSLPPYEAFHDILRNKNPHSIHEYNEANTRYQEWGCTSLKVYYMNYLKLDVYLLADVFQNFRAIAHREDGLEPLHFFSIKGLTWASAFKMTGSRVDLLQDISMYEWYESAIRGGLCFVNIHYSKREKDVELLYVDVNNLYGWALSEYLPCSNFEWIYDEDILTGIMQQLPNMICSTMTTGYMLEVDVSTPPSLHDYFDYLPPCCHNAIPPPQLFPSG